MTNVFVTKFLNILWLFRKTKIISASFGFWFYDIHSKTLLIWQQSGR